LPSLIINFSATFLGIRKEQKPEENLTLSVRYKVYFDELFPLVFRGSLRTRMGTLLSDPADDFERLCSLNPNRRDQLES